MQNLYLPFLRSASSLIAQSIVFWSVSLESSAIILSPAKLINFSAMFFFDLFHCKKKVEIFVTLKCRKKEKWNKMNNRIFGLLLTIGPNQLRLVRGMKYLFFKEFDGYKMSNWNDWNEVNNGTIWVWLYVRVFHLTVQWMLSNLNVEVNELMSCEQIVNDWFSKKNLNCKTSVQIITKLVFQRIFS